MILMLIDLTNYKRKIEGRFGKEHTDSIIPSTVVGKEGKKWRNSGH